jgi:tetratricopeptide (TPR) repeat protein
MDVGDSKLEALLLLAGLEGRRDNRALAREYYKRVRDQATQTGNSVALSIALHELGIFLQKDGKLFDAEQHYVKSLELCLQFNDGDGAARTTAQLGKLKELQGDQSGALLQYLSARELFKKINSPMQEQAEHDAIRLLAKIARDKKDTYHREGFGRKILRWLRIK